MTQNFPIFEALKRHGVPFVIIGGHAVNFHGHTRLTEDTDVVWLRSADSEIALGQALSEIRAQYIGDDIDPVTKIERTYPVTHSFIQTHALMMLCTDLGFLDLFAYVPGFPEANVQEFFDQSVEAGGFRYASISWLRKMKAAAGRNKDMDDLRNLPLG